MNLTIDREKNVACIRLTGPLDRGTILGAFDATVADEGYRAGMGRIWDFRDADLSLLDAATVTEMAQYSRQFPPGVRDVKVAFVTSRDLEFGLSRMFEMSSRADTPIQVFRDMKAAEEWIGQ